VSQQELIVPLLGAVGVLIVGGWSLSLSLLLGRIGRLEAAVDALQQSNSDLARLLDRVCVGRHESNVVPTLFRNSR
jgi:hypothetical protein